MVLRLYSKTPDLLLPGQYVKFEAKDDVFAGASHIPSGSFWKVEITNQITFTRSFIFPPGEKKTVSFDNNEDYTNYFNLTPTSPDTLYEILVGLKGGKDILIYPMIPSENYLNKLESPHLNVDLADDIKRQISPIRVYDSPVDEPKLMVYTVKDMETLYFRFYNDGPDYEKIIIHFIVNRCKIKKVDYEPDKYRIIQSYDLLGRW